MPAYTKPVPSEIFWPVLLASVTLQKFVERIVTLLDDPSLAKRMGAAGRVFVEEKWRWDEIVKQHQAMLN